MKQRFLLSLVFVCAFMVTTRAQISKGAVWVGGSIGYNQSKSGSDTPYSKTNNVNLNPAVGIVVKDNLVVGISLLYGHSKTEDNGYYRLENKSNTYGVGLFVRQYIPIVSRLYVFGEAGVNYRNSKGTSTYKNYPGGSKSTSKGWVTGLNVTPGVSFAVTKKFHLETSFNNLLGIAYMKNEIKTEPPIGSGMKPTTTKNDQFTAGLSSGGKVEFNVGCRFLL
jgi:hypothetical protein